MYTQCPDCNTAFRVTAEVLKQAAGKVRCGGCGNAFNALEYLSEDKPTPAETPAPEPSLPELKPETETPPQTISAEQSAALLKTLDELAGSDIRIEDTGVEWRVLDDEEEDEVVDVFDTRAAAVDEVLEESPTPVDQFLTATPNEIDAAEVFDEQANAPATTPVDELRFDDNTPLPDDFDFGDESPYVPDTPAIEEPPPLEVPQADLDLSEPDEWEDILDEFNDLRSPSPAPLEAELAALEAEAPIEDASPELSAEPVSEEEKELLDMDTQFALQAEAMGIDLSGMHQRVDKQAAEGSVEEAAAEPAEEAAAEPEEASAEPEEATAEPEEATAEPEETAAEPEETAAEPEEVTAEPEEAADGPDEEPAVDATQLDMIEEDVPEDEEPTLGFGAVEEALAELEEKSDVFDSEFFKAADEVAAELEEGTIDLDEVQVEAVEMPGDDALDLDEVQVEAVEELGDDALDLDEVQVEAVEELGDDALDLEATDEETSDSIEELMPDVDEAAEESVDLSAEIELEEDLDLGAPSDLKQELDLAAEPYPEEELELDALPAGEAKPEEPEVPPLTEEEQTINMMIDQDLLSVAVEDEDGFASTIIIAEKEAGAKDKKKRKKDKKHKKKRKKEKAATAEFGGDSAQGFETIIMEGEHIRSPEDEGKREADAAEAAELVAAAKAKEAAAAAASSGSRARVIGAIVVLVLLLIVQVLHQSREALATNAVFNKIASPVYRAIGQPLLPAWDIRGWRIEASTDSVENNDETLVVYSRIANQSDTPLPYPIINISLTDRFEETLGSRQLDPAEYLPSGLDPSKLVEPGNNFNAVISIQSLAAEASGYRLDVCYRGSGEQLRCAIADFK